MDFGGVMARLAALAEQNIKINECDYKVDGLWFCGKCRSPKQVRLVNEDGSFFTPLAVCKCEQERLKREEEETRRRTAERRLKEMQALSDESLRGCTFANDDGGNQRLTSICRRYCERWERMKADGKGLLLFGTVGTGKSFMAAAIANELMKRGVSSLVTSFAKLIDRDDIDLDAFELVVIDDLGAERDTGYMSERVLDIIDSRYRSGKPLIVTTNLTAEELKNPPDLRHQRIYSRLLEMCVPVEVKGKDRRRDKLKNKYAEYADLLGI